LEIEIMVGAEEQKNKNRSVKRCYLDLFKALTSMSGPLCRCAVRLLLGILSRFNE
jgi:hypothetical protein